VTALGVVVVCALLSGARLPDGCNGHGTHAAGFIGANGAGADAARGVAPGVTLGAYRVFGCGGSTTDDIMRAAYRGPQLNRGELDEKCCDARFWRACSCRLDGGRPHRGGGARRQQR
jgi:subtilase family protein